MTSTIISSRVRQTAAFTVPSTQNTAPVLEFRCLYTHDLRRKQKRWQDGLLRFHTFNKRIMVYDVSRNYIGDMHWREDEVLQDGDEFQLDRGVLIQVGEATGSIDQDLTGLFEKRKKAPDVIVNEEVSHQPAAVSNARPTAAQPSQLRPKSLNALLGTPKGRIGRAALPAKSPHELRTEIENSGLDHDRALKRQRIELQPERSSETRDSESTEQPRKQNQGQHALLSPRDKKTRKYRNNEPETGYARKSDATNPSEIAADEDTLPTDERPKQKIKLQMASRKPRKKLMYRDLLPQEPSAIGRSSVDTSVLDRSNRNRSTSSRPNKRKIDPMAEFHEKEQEQLKVRLNKHRAKEIQRDKEREELCGDAPKDLFLSQEGTDAMPAKNHGTEEKGPKDKVLKSSIKESRRRNTDPLPPSIRRSLSPKASRKVLPRPPSTVHSSAMALAKMDEILFLRPQPKITESVESKDALQEVSPQELSPRQISKIPPDIVPSLSPPKDKPGSSLAFQTQVHVPSTEIFPLKAPFSKRTHSRPNPDSESAITEVVQPSAQGPKQRSPNIQSPDPQLSSTPITPPNIVPTPFPPRDLPTSAPSLQTPPEFHTNRSPTPEQRLVAVVAPTSSTKLDSLSAFSKIVAPKPPVAPDPVPKSKPNNQPAFAKVTQVIPISRLADETVEVLSSQPSSPPPEAPITIIVPNPPRRKPDSLPAFTKVVPAKPRSQLKKTVSDTTAMRPPSAFPVAGGKERALPDDLGGRDESARLWGKEAWDLFGCGRDGIECTYEEFKGKEGSM